MIINSEGAIQSYEKENWEGWLLWWLRGSVVMVLQSGLPWVRVPQLLVFLFSPFSQSRLGSNETSIILLQSLPAISISSTISL